MSVLEQLYARRDELAQQMRGMIEAAEAEDRDLDEAETEQFAEAEAQFGQLTARIERAERVDQVDGALSAARPAAARGQGPVLHAPGPEARREFETVAEFLHAVRFNTNDQRLSNLYHEGPDLRGEQRMDTGSSGGFAVPAQFRAELMRVDPAMSIVRPRAFVIEPGSPPDAPITMPALDQGGSAAGNMYGGVNVQWVAEGAAKPETEMGLRDITLEPQEVTAHLIATDKLLRNWGAAASVIERQFRDAVAGAEDAAFIAGNGVGKPMGFINGAARHLVTRTTANLVQYADVEEMSARLLRRGGMPAWVASVAIRSQLTSLRNKDGSEGDGALVWQPSLRDGEPERLMGYPILWSERASALGSIGDLSLVDLSHYVIKDGSGPFVATSEHVKFLENKTVFKVFWNVDGRPWLTGPLTLENGFVASPFVVLGLPA